MKNVSDEDFSGNSSRDVRKWNIEILVPLPTLFQDSAVEYLCNSPLKRCTSRKSGTQFIYHEKGKASRKNTWTRVLGRSTIIQRNVEIPAEENKMPHLIARKWRKRVGVIRKLRWTPCQRQFCLYSSSHVGQRRSASDQMPLAIPSLLNLACGVRYFERG